MIKKLALIFLIIFTFIYLIYTMCNTQMEICTKEEAINIAQTYVKVNNKEMFVNTITNFDSPTVEMVYIDKLVVHASGEKKIIKNKKCYKIVFKYPLDVFLGTYDVYVNYNNSECYGSTIKM